MGDGWFPSLVPASAVAAGAARLAEWADSPVVIAVGAVGALGEGTMSQQEIAAQVGLAYGHGVPEVPNTGGPDEAASRFAEFRAAGATHLVLGFADGDWRRQCDLLAEAAARLR